MATAKLRILVLVVVFSLGLSTLEAKRKARMINEATKNTFTFLLQCYQDKLANLVRNSSAKEDAQMNLEAELKRDEISNTPTPEPTFQSETINFPINSYMANVMFQLFGKDGILEKGGFVRNGYVFKNASSSVVMLGSFGNRSQLLQEVMKAHHSPIGAGVLALVVQLFFTPGDFRRLTSWLRAEIRAGVINYDDPCSPIVAIKFVCCTNIADPFLTPKFGTLRVDID